jgi:hypothetical protein
MSLNSPFRVCNYLMMTSGFHREVGEICTLLRYYAAFSDKRLSTLQENIWLPYSRFKKSKKKLHSTDRLSRNVSNELPLRAAQSLGRSQISTSDEFHFKFIAEIR